MKKLAVLGLAIVLAGLPGGVASAQNTGLRDPFEPLISPDEQTTTDATTTTTTTDTTDVDDPSASDTPDEGLPTTGSSVVDWLGIAYVLATGGLGLLALARLYQPGGGRARKRAA